MHKIFFRRFCSVALLGAGVLFITLAFSPLPGPVGKLLHGIGSFYVQMLVGCLVLGVLAPLTMAALNWLFEQAERGIQWVYADIGQSYYRRKIEPEIIRTGRLPEFGSINNGSYRVVDNSEESRT
jgi:hypothetical protein